MRMLATEIIRYESKQKNTPVPQGALPAELDFYEGYAWSLNPHLTVREAIGHIREEIGRLPVVPCDWRAAEVVSNVYLLSCAVLNAAEEYLRGPGLRPAFRLAAARAGRTASWIAANVVGDLGARRRPDVRRWLQRWRTGLHAFLSVAVSEKTFDPGAFAEAGGKLAALLSAPLPSAMQASVITVPSPFRRLDLTCHDVIALGKRYIERFPDRSQAILLVGLRTSGSYFAPLLRAFLAAQGYERASMLTLSPHKGAGRRERKELRRFAEQGYTALIVDDPPQTGGAIFTALEIACRAGFGRDKVRVLVPAHSAKQHWCRLLADGFVVSLEREKWHKWRLLEPNAVQGRLAEYFASRNFVRASVIESSRAEEMNSQLQNGVSDERGARLKRIFEVELETPEGQIETRYVLAKSVGWGWLGYHAFLAGHRLAGFVPAILGLREGILYMEWMADSAPELNGGGQASTRIDVAASYIAARARRLGLSTDSVAGMDPPRQDNGIRLLRAALSRAYGRFPIDVLAGPRLGRLLRRQPCPFPALIDGNMQRHDWIVGAHGPLKTDYEHHGLGKEELNVVDPAYDLADTILNLGLSAEEEKKLVRQYVEQSGDVLVERRLLLNKLLAGLWAMKRAHDQLFGKAAASERQQALHRRFMAAWDFLTVQAARYCGGLCRPSAAPRWRSPLVALDIDGVLDRRLFGFPCTTAAGVEALSLLRAHDLSVVVNTARSIAEVKAYCEAYALAGGVAEHGSYLWDAVNQRGRAIVGPEATRQLDELKKNLRRIPGVFLDDRHQYSIRAFTYQDKPRSLSGRLLRFIRSAGVGEGDVAPLPTLVVQHLMTELGLDRLCFHHTTIDTTIVAKDVDKGSGLTAFRDWVLGADAETIAVGDQEADLAMFRLATRCFAPANIGCARQARLLGCQIASRPYQRGLLEIARAITHPTGRPCARCGSDQSTSPPAHDLFVDILRAADRSSAKNLLAVLLHRAADRIFRR
jgi:hydroxymethylpyrimidine pyrophosphatase-like HAD family hydrolase